MKSSKIFERIVEAVWRESFDDFAERVLEKKTRDVSSIGWKTIRAAREPERHNPNRININHCLRVRVEDTHHSWKRLHIHLGLPMD